MNKTAKAITVAMIADPSGGTSWQAQIQMEFKGAKGFDALNVSGPNPMMLLQRCCHAIDKKLKIVNGVTIKPG